MRKRSALGMAALAVLLASTLWLTLRQRRSGALVRVGGMSNACACSQRIEP